MIVVSRDDFRAALSELVDYESNPINRWRVRRALRRDRIFDRWYERAAPRIEAGLASNPNLKGVDFDAIMDWLVENWDEILKILLTILPLLI